MPLFWTEILEERQSQDDEHGGPETDDENTQYHWVSYITKQLGQAVVDTSTKAGPLPAAYKFRFQMVRVAALAVASIEWVDRVIEAIEEQNREANDA